MTENEDKKELQVIADAMLDKKAKGVVSLDLTGIGTAITDHFVMCNADSTTQVVAICDNVEEMMYAKCKRSPIRKQGRENAFWVILDYGNIVAHIFKTEYREFYRLEDLWADAQKTEYDEQR
ncbi:MAG: ribosome silencing factor [Bacteroidales bacterium]|nr:ribosome silencing factor [Bacteroidales bacterium]